MSTDNTEVTVEQGEAWDVNDDLRTRRWRIVRDEFESVYHELVDRYNIPPRFVETNILRSLLRLIRFDAGTVKITKTCWPIVDEYVLKVRKDALGDAAAHARQQIGRSQNKGVGGADSMGEKIARTRLGMSGGLTSEDYRVLHPLDWPD